MKIKVFVILTALSFLYGCGNKQSKQQSTDTLQVDVVHVQDNVEDSLKDNITYLSNKGNEILCTNNLPQLSADFSTKSKLSEDEIKAFAAKMKVQPTKTLSFYYEGLDLPPYAMMVDGVVDFNNNIPNTLAEAQKYQKEKEEKRLAEQAQQARIEKAEKERLERTKRAIRKSIVGNWVSEESPDLSFCIYKKNGKYYAGKLDKDTYEISEMYRLVRVSSRRYEDRDNGDMPERFDIQPNGDMRTSTYNPDAPGGGAWVYMGTWYATGY